MARRRLSKAGEYLSANLYSAFYEELHLSLLGYASDKLTLDISSLSQENIASSLEAAGASSEDCEKFCSLLSDCEYARYSPDAGHEAMRSHYDAALEVISTIDDSMKKHGSVRGTRPEAALLVILLLSLSAPASLRAQSSDLWQEGVSLYESGDYAGALERWTSIEQGGEVSSYLYYNLGNACFRLDDVAHAIIYFRRALRLDPSDSDALFNLEFARSFVQDKIESVPEFFLRGWARSFSHLLSCNGWGVLSLLFFALSLALALLFLLSARRGLRKLGFYGALSSVLLCLVCFAAGSGIRKELLSSDSAVVVRPVVCVKSAPGAESSTDLFILHEGTEVKILDSASSWVDISLSDGRQGWLQASEIEII